MGSHAVVGAGSLKSLKAVFRVLREKDVRVARSTLLTWRTTLTGLSRPPVDIQIIRNRPTVVCSKRALIDWVERMERKGFFEQARRNHETRERRRNPPSVE